MFNKICNIILCVGIPYVAVSFTTAKFGVTFGFAVMILCLMALFIYFKPHIYNIIGRMKYGTNHDEAFKYMEKSYKTGRMKPQSALVYAYVLLRDGHLSKAERIISAVLLQKKKKLTEENILAAELNSAIILWKKSDLPSAIEKMEKVYDTGYRSTVHYQTLGIFYIMNNDLDKAQKFIDEALEYNSDDASILDNLGLLYIKKGEYAKAEKVYEELFDSCDPDFIEANYNYATVLARRGDYEGACKYYQKALGCPERYLSTVKHSLVEIKLSDAEAHL